VNGINVVFQRVLAMYDSGCKICCTDQDSRRVLICQHTEVLCHRYHDTQTSHIILKPGQSVLL